MALILVESHDLNRLKGFIYGLKFADDFVLEVKDSNLDPMLEYSTKPWWVLLEDEDEDDNLTCTLRDDGLVFKALGVEL